jgi:ATP-binding cassette subfamily B protein
LAIARALVGNPRLLILDEATSHLDAESERIIQTNLSTIRQNRTIVLIAHRLSTIRNADLILVLDRGVLIESGTHAELMAKRGHYFYLNQQQLAVC